MASELSIKLVYPDNMSPLPKLLSTAFLEVADTPWDAIVIGTGLGGATLGYALAKAGWRVLFCERGLNYLANPQALTADYPEMLIDHDGSLQHARQYGELLRSGRFDQPVSDQSEPHHHHFLPFIGSGSGGSSALYGMAFERFAASDFEPGRWHARATDSSLDATWPLDYKAFCAYYRTAEQLYRVRGSAEPMRADRVFGFVGEPPDCSAAGARLSAHFNSLGLHPYRLPLACEFVDGCQCCQGYLCAQRCKNDSARICLEPALRDHGAQLLDGCRVVRLEADRHQVTGVVCDWQGQSLSLHAKHVFLAAGALQSPNLLLRSASVDWPQGLANTSGRVGRNLMRHCIDMYVIQTRAVDRGPDFDNRFKELAFNDFYCVDGMKLGSVQSFGRLPPGSMLFESLRQDLQDATWSWLAQLFAFGKPLLTPLLQRMVDQSITLASTLEDLPYEDNRVMAAADEAPEAVRLSYRLHEDDRRRLELFRARLRGVLKGLNWRLIKQADNNQRIAHACGTCRMGLDPRTSVLDANNRCHDLDNLYVVDSSFFPSSGGTNPGLTIAANALRVADHLTGSMNCDQVT